MVLFITVHAQIHLEKEMHNNNYRRKSGFAGFLAVGLLVLAILFALGFYTNYIPRIDWRYSPLIIIIVIFATIAGLASRKRRLKEEARRRSGIVVQTSYKKYEPQQTTIEEKKPTDDINYKYRNNFEKQFCNFCGIKLESEEQSFCINCGQRL